MRKFLFLYSIILIVLIQSCKVNSTEKEITTEIITEFITLSGKTMGTTYSIKLDKNIPSLKYKVDSLLASFNTVFSTYDSLSTISRFNEYDSNEFCFIDSLGSFHSILETSMDVYQTTNGYFDPTVMPLVSYWGFGPQKVNRTDVNQTVIDSLNELTGLEKLSWHLSKNELCITKPNSQMSLDLSAIAKGFGVDEVANLLIAHEIENFMVEIGGEVVAKGVNSVDLPWGIAIDRPISISNIQERELQAIVGLNNKAMASSGNYRNFYTSEGKLIGHTINPKTGKPEINNLLSVSVLADKCVIADAFATGFMAIGFEEAFNIADKSKAVDAYFIYLDIDNSVQIKYTEGFQEILKDVN